MEPNDKLKVSQKPSQYLSLGKGEYFDRKNNQIVVLKNGEFTPTGKTPTFKKDQAGNQVVKGNNGGYVGVNDGKTYLADEKRNTISAQNQYNFAEPPPTASKANAQFMTPDPTTGTINYFAEGGAAPSPTSQPKGKAKATPKAAPAPSTPQPTANRPNAAQLLSGLPTTSNDASVGAYTDPSVFKTTTPSVLNTGLKPAIPNVNPSAAVTPTNQPGGGAAGANWQSYIGLGTDLVSGAIGMAMANKPLTPFKQPQAYDTMMQEVTQRRNEGLPAEQLGMAAQRTQNQYSTDIGSISRIANGSAGLYMAGLQGASANAQNAQLATSALDQQVRMQNQQVFASAAIQDMNREQMAFGQLRQEEIGARNAFAQAGAANFQQAGARMDYIQQYENPDSFYNLLRANMTDQINGWSGYLKQPIRP